MGVGEDSSGKEDIEVGGDTSVSISRAVKDREEGWVRPRGSSGTGDTGRMKGLAGPLNAELESKSRL